MSAWRQQRAPDHFGRPTLRSIAVGEHRGDVPVASHRVALPKASSGRAFETGGEARDGIGRWIGYYNADRPHSALAGRTPDEAYAIDMAQEKLAA